MDILDGFFSSMILEANFTGLYRACSKLAGKKLGKKNVEQKIAKKNVGKIVHCVTRRRSVCFYGEGKVLFSKLPEP